GCGGGRDLDGAVQEHGRVAREQERVRAHGEGTVQMKDDRVARVRGAGGVVLALDVVEGARADGHIRAAEAVHDGRGRVRVVDERRVEVVLAGGAERGLVGDD